MKIFSWCVAIFIGLCITKIEMAVSELKSVQDRNPVLWYDVLRVSGEQKFTKGSRHHVEESSRWWVEARNSEGTEFTFQTENPFQATGFRAGLRVTLDPTWENYRWHGYKAAWDAMGALYAWGYLLGVGLLIAISVLCGRAFG